MEKRKKKGLKWKKGRKKDLNGKKEEKRT